MKNADENELRSIASDPDSIHMYNVADFSFLLNIVDNLTDNLCNSVKGPGIHEFTAFYFPDIWVECKHNVEHPRPIDGPRKATLEAKNQPSSWK